MVYGQLPKYLINRLQRVQNTTAGYVYGRYAKTLDVINLNWLRIEENIEMNTVRFAHKSLNNESWSNYLKLALIERKRNLRSLDLGSIIKQRDDHTFQQQATVYNNVPKAFSRKIEEFYKDKPLARFLNFVLSLEFDFCFHVQLYSCCVLLQPVVFPVSISILFSTLVSDHPFCSISFLTVN